MKNKNKNENVKLKLKEEKDLSKSIDKYQKPTLWSRIPYAVKALVLKYWFFGAICFFVLMGLGTQGVQGLTAALIAGLIGGCVMDIIYGNILFMMDSDKKESQYYMLYKNKSIWSLLINVGVALVEFIICAYFCSWIVGLISDPNNWFLQEPLSQALVLIVIDGIFLLIKYGIVYLVRRNKAKTSMQRKVD